MPICQDELINQIVEFLLNKMPVDLIIIFGSFTQNRLKKDSDIDIAFLSDKVISSYECFMIGQELADILGRDVDLVNLQKASTVFKAQIVEYGKAIYFSSETILRNFQMNALKEYCKLNEERAVILQKINERGYVYG